MSEPVQANALWQALQQPGCDSFQGKPYGRPLPAEDLPELLRKRCHP